MRDQQGGLRFNKKQWVYPKIQAYLFQLVNLGFTVKDTAAVTKSLQSCLTLCDPVDGSPPGYAIPGILQERTLEWVATSFSNAWKVKVKSLSCVWIFANPMDCSLPGSSVHGIFQARLLEWVAIDFSAVKGRWSQILVGFRSPLRVCQGSDGPNSQSCWFSMPEWDLKIYMYNWY